MGRDKSPVSEAIALALEKLAGDVAKAVAWGEFERARELTEEAIRLCSTGAPDPDGVPPIRGAAE